MAFGIILKLLTDHKNSDTLLCPAWCRRAFLFIKYERFSKLTSNGKPHLFSLTKLVEHNYLGVVKERIE
jgi:hypothetical protein